MYFCNLIVKTKKMQDNKLLQLFSALSGYERKKLRRFLLSPYHNEREDLILLFDYLQNLLKTKSEFDKNTAWRAIYADNRAYCDADMRCIMTFLLQRIAAFLQAEALAKDASQQHKYLSQAYLSHNLPQHAKQNIRRRQQQLGYHFQNYNHIINFALRLIELPQSPKNKATQLRHDIENTQNFTERDWFLLQIH